VFKKFQFELFLEIRAKRLSKAKENVHPDLLQVFFIRTIF